jgi:RNA-binding protein
MLNGKQRSYLRGLANTIPPVIQLGKDGITDAVIKQVDDVLESRELIKLTILRNSILDPREACDMLCEATGSDPVQVIGNRFAIYRKSKNKPPQIVLPR